MSRNERVEVLLDRFKELKAKKEPWLAMYQSVAEYVRYRKQVFTTAEEPGKFQNEDIFDTTAPHSNQKFASALQGALYPAGAKSIIIRPADSMPKTSEINDYFSWVTKETARYLDHPRSGFTLAQSEYFQDIGAFGTGGIASFEVDDIDAPMRFKHWGIEGLYYDENADGVVDTVLRTYKWAVRKIVETFGIDNVSKNVRDKFQKKLFTEKVELLHILQPREHYSVLGLGNLNMPVSSIHIDISSKHIMKESGFANLPVAISRLYKGSGELYSRSPAIEALPDIVTLNALVEAVLLSTEKQLNPPLAVLDDGRLGNGVINTSAGAVNVLKTQGAISNGNIIQPLFTVGELNSTYQFIQELRGRIEQAFFVDRLLDFNTETEMTAFETNIRDRLRGQALNGLFGRQEAEMYLPVIERSVNSFWDRGLLGVFPEDQARADALREQGIEARIIPQEVVNKIQSGADVFKIDFISPARRMVDSEIASSILNAYRQAVDVAQVDPQVMDNFESDEMSVELAKLNGMPDKFIRGVDGVEQIRQQRAQQQAQLAEQEAQKSQAVVSRDMAHAMSMVNGGSNGGR